MKKKTIRQILSVFLAAAVCLTLGAAFGLQNQEVASAEQAVTAKEPVEDASPAIYVAQKTANSVVGVITSAEQYNQNTREVETRPVAQGSGVVIREGGYVVTNFHVIADGNTYQVIMPSGEKVDAKIVGTDNSTDMAVLQVAEEYRDQLVPAEITSSADLIVGSTAIAIGNPGGEVLANTVTQGIISALERTSVNGSNTYRTISYIQHDAAINSGNSGGGLFNYKGQLIGINTLKYSGSAYYGSSYEGLGFAIPSDTVKTITDDLIEHGKVLRPQMGVSVNEWDNGPDEPTKTWPQKSVYIVEVNEGSPAEKAGMQQYDFIYSVDGERVTNMLELTAKLDQHEAGDTIQVVVVRYDDVSKVGVSYNNNDASSYPDFSDFFGWGFGYGFGGRQQQQQRNEGSDFEFVTLNITLEIIE